LWYANGYLDAGKGVEPSTWAYGANELPLLYPARHKDTILKRFLAKDLTNGFGRVIFAEKYWLC
jgi:hypothetical protein